MTRKANAALDAVGVASDLVHALMTDSPQLADDTLASRVIKGLDDKTVARLAWQYVKEMVWDSRRRLARLAEERALMTQSSGTSTQESSDKRNAAWYHKPELAARASSGQRKTFRKWVHKHKGPEAWGLWMKKAQDLLSEGKWPGISTDVEDLNAEWSAEGWQAYHRNNAAGELAAWISLELSKVKERAAEQARLDLTQELLESVFALGDGVRVTWAKATEEQHEQRVEMVLKNATANMEDAVRHQVAINMLRAQGVSCLAEIAVAA